MTILNSHLKTQENNNLKGKNMEICNLKDKTEYLDEVAKLNMKSGQIIKKKIEKSELKEKKKK